MKTEIAKFCKEYETVLKPFSGSLKETLDCINKESRQNVLRVTVAGLNDVGHRLKSLVEKIEGQQAYLLIFGPLKSGKSTLMNAISGTYVSEVTSLPAYPCLVYVSHGDKQTFSAHKYNGKVKTYADNQDLQDGVTSAHTLLADRIRQKEQEGGDFDPGVDFPDAIRRVDIRLPIQNLQESSTVMVDTPGLYSRMKFGYDLMTREFRNTAACAVFVVKTDNLYLEQVFAEFKDLLDLFSRIFLVVNIDSSKRDLRPDGTLGPSLESENPQRIIEAFESLAMNAQLRSALDEGRLKIYPIDLLNAASSFLKNGEPVAEGEGDDTIVFPGQEAENDGSVAYRNGKETFDIFLMDLTDYLNSSEYFVEFVQDSLRLGKTLCDEVENHFAEESLDEFRRSQEELSRQLEETEAKSAAADALRKHDSKGLFDRIRKDNDSRASEMTESLYDEISVRMGESLHRWYESADSVRDLVDNHWGPIINEFTNKVGDQTIERISKLVSTPYGGADFSEEAMNEISKLGLSLPEISRTALEPVKKKESFDVPTMALREEGIPMRKTFIDWILFRNQASIRKRVLGLPGDLSLSIAPETKKKRLGDEGLQALHQLGIEAFRDQFRSIPSRMSASAMSRYVEEFTKQYDEKVVAVQKELAEKTGFLKGRIGSDQVISQSIEELRGKVGEIREAVSALEIDYAMRPVKAEDVTAASIEPTVADDWRLLWA